MKTDIQTMSEQERVMADAFDAAFKNGMIKIQEAGEKLAEWLEINPSALELANRMYGYPIRILRRLVEIGERKLLPQLFPLLECSGKIPMEDQKRIVSGQVEALVLKPDGSTDKILVDILGANRDMVRQVIGPRGIRSLAEQRLELVRRENMRIAAKLAQGSKPTGVPYRVHGKKIVIGNAEFTASDLLNMLKLIS